jgi:hypothetical protein
MGDEPWNTEAARNALILLREAHDDWLMLLPTAHDRIGDPAPERTLRTLHQHAAAVLTWVRGLNDMAVGNNGLSGYPDTAKTPVELVDAAVYACNRAIHQLIAVGQYEVGGRRYPPALLAELRSVRGYLGGGRSIAAGIGRRREDPAPTARGIPNSVGWKADGRRACRDSPIHGHRDRARRRAMPLSDRRAPLS